MLRKMWNGEGIPEDWKRGVIYPIYKKGDKRVAKSYRGVTEELQRSPLMNGHSIQDLCRDTRRTAEGRD